MSKIIIKRSNKEIEIVDYKGKFEDMNKLLNLKDLVYTPLELRRRFRDSRTMAIT